MPTSRVIHINHMITTESGEEALELPLILTFDYYPGDPGRLSGPPENCYPPEPAECELTAVSIDMSQINEDFQEQLEERIYEDYTPEEDY